MRLLGIRHEQSCNGILMDEPWIKISFYDSRGQKDDSGELYDKLLTDRFLLKVPRVGEYIWFPSKVEGHTAWVVDEIAHWVGYETSRTHRAAAFCTPVKESKEMREGRMTLSVGVGVVYALGYTMYKKVSEATWEEVKPERYEKVLEEIAEDVREVLRVLKRRRDIVDFEVTADLGENRMHLTKFKEVVLMIKTKSSPSDIEHTKLLLSVDREGKNLYSRHITVNPLSAMD